jgi:hypothetical protein
MNFQEKMLDASAELRACAAALATSTLHATRARASVAARRVARLRKSFSILEAARREFSSVARQHAKRFVKQNSPLVAAVRKDVSELARSTYRTLATGNVSRKSRRDAPTRKRARKAA